MKLKTFTLLLLLSIFGTATAQEVVFTTTYNDAVGGSDAVPGSFKFTAWVPGDGGEISVDWGDGDIKNYSGTTIPFSLTSPIAFDGTERTIKVSSPAMTSFLLLNGKGITSITANSLALTEIECTESKLTTIDLTNVPNLKSLNLRSNLITTINLSTVPNLTNLEIRDNQMVSVNLSALTQLAALDASAMPNLESLDLSANTALISLEIYKSPKMTSVNLLNNSRLQIFDCHENGIIDLDLGACVALKTLKCNTNKLEVLNLTGLTALESLECYNNKLVELDLSQAAALKTLDCKNNLIEVLKLNENASTSITSFNCSSNMMTYKTLPVVKKLSSTTGAEMIYLPQNAGDLTVTPTGRVLDMTWVYDLDAKTREADPSFAGALVFQVRQGDSSSNGVFDASSYTNASGLLTFGAAVEASDILVRFRSPFFGSTLQYTSVFAIPNNTTGVDLNTANKALVYPTIFTDNVTIQGGNAVEVVDLSGKSVYSKTLSSDIENVDLSFLGSGVYLVRVSTTEGVNTTKIMKK